MKCIFFSFLFFCTSISVAQLKDDGKEKTDLILPSDKVALNELLEETKQKIDDDNSTISLLNSYYQALQPYYNRVNNFIPTKLDDIYKNIGTAISAKSNDKMIKGEQELNTYFNSLDFYFRIQSAIPTVNGSQNNQISPNAINLVNNNYNNFTAKISQELKSINTNEILNNVIDNIGGKEPVLNSNEKLESLKSVLNSNIINNIKSNLLAIINNEISSNKSNLEQIQLDLQNEKTNRIKILQKLNEQATQINDLAIKLGLPLFCSTILLLFLVPSLIKSNSGDKDSQTSYQNVLLEISTVLLLTMSILILGLSTKIQSDVLGTLLGGISGYVLNRVRNRADQTVQK